MSNRPISPHLSHYKWGPHMTVSILHRATGMALAVAGVALLTAFLVSVAMGEDAFATFRDWATWPPALIVPIGLTWAFFQHLASGVRHLILDTGAGYELNANRTGAIAAMAFGVVATALVWGYVLVGAR